MNIVSDVARVLGQFRRDGGKLEPGALDWLYARAKKSIDGLYFALTTPCAEDTQDVVADLAGANPDGTGLVPVVWNRPVEILAMLPTVIPVTATAGLRTPTPSDLIVSMRSDQTRNYTNADIDGQAGSSGTGGDQFVSLASFSVLTPRIFRVELPASRPVVDFAFRWAIRPPAAPTPPLYQDCQVRLSLFWRFLDDRAP